MTDNTWKDKPVNDPRKLKAVRGKLKALDGDPEKADSRYETLPELIVDIERPFFVKHAASASLPFRSLAGSASIEIGG